MGQTLSVFLIVIGRVKVEPRMSDILKAWESFYTQQTQDIHPILFQCWASVEGVVTIVCLRVKSSKTGLLYRNGHCAGSIRCMHDVADGAGVCIM